MVKFRYIGDEPRAVSILPSGEIRRMDPDQLFEVDGDYWESYASQPHLYEALDEDPNRQGIEAVLADVGDDPAAAVQALDAERRTRKPRTTLLRKLEEIAKIPEAGVGALPVEDGVTRPDVPAQPAPAEPAFVEPTQAATPPSK
jgi:hypothetical protein